MYPPEIKPRKAPRPAYRKPDAVKHLEQLADAEARRQHPNIDPRYLAPRKYKDNTANDLTKCVIDFIRLTGGQAERINSTGRYIDQSQVFTDVIGRTRSIGTGQWIPSSGSKGTADISAVIGGRAVKIEIKMKDRQSEDQKRYQEQIERVGGVYLIVRSFDEFLTWYQNLTK